MAENHPTTKHCARCQSDKPISEFYTNGTNKDGSPRLKAECKACERLRMAKWREANPRHSTDWNRRNPGRSNARARARYAAIPADQHRRMKKQSREKRRDGELAYAKAYREKHSERAKAYAKKYNPAYYERNRDKFLAKSSDWYATNKERAADRAREYTSTPRGKAVRAQVANKRRAALAGAAAENLTEYIAAIKASALVECHICGESLPGSECQIDHIIPLARGGTHTKDNIAPAHPLCNMRKGAKLNFKMGGDRRG